MLTEKMPKMSPLRDEIIPESALFDEDEEQTPERTQTALFSARRESPKPKKSEFPIPNPTDDFFMDFAK